MLLSIFMIAFDFVYIILEDLRVILILTGNDIDSDLDVRLNGLSARCIPAVQPDYIQEEGTQPFASTS